MTGTKHWLDVQLVNGCLRGEAEANNKLYEIIRRAVAHHRIQPSTAGDVCQAVAERLIVRKAIAGYRGHAALKTYIKRAVGHEIGRQLNEVRSQVRELLFEPGTTNNPERSHRKQEYHELAQPALLRALSDLRQDQLRLLEQKLEGLTQEEMARQRGVQQPAISKQFTDIKHQLLTAMQHYLSARMKMSPDELEQHLASILSGHRHDLRTILDELLREEDPIREDDLFREE